MPTPIRSDDGLSYDELIDATLKAGQDFGATLTREQAAYISGVVTGTIAKYFTLTAKTFPVEPVSDVSDVAKVAEP